MIGYASRTGTRSTLAALRAAGWRLLVSAAGELRPEGMRHGVDNGAWTAYQRGQLIDLDRYSRALNKLGRDADFVVMPDIVCGGEDSLELTFRWMQRTLALTQVALVAVQDGHETWQIDELLGPRVGVFVGGTTEWKVQTMGKWAAAARTAGAWCHVGRVNTRRRIVACGVAGVTSFDGTSVTQFPSTLPLLQGAVAMARSQRAMHLDSADPSPWNTGGPT